MSNTLAQEIFSQLTKEINESSNKNTLSHQGIIREIRDEVVIIEGLNEIGFGATLDFGNNILGMVVDLDEEFVGAIVFNNYQLLKEGMSVTSNGKSFSVNVSNDILGRVVNGTGQIIDGQKPISKGEDILVDSIAPGVIERKSVNQPLQTGIKAIDALVPIGRGQRELIIGDRRTGKTTIALDTVINQSKENVICIYNFIGSKSSNVAQSVQILKEKGALSNSVVVAATASDSSAMQYIAPYCATAIAEYFMKQGKDVLIVYDDLSKHAWAYRQISLVLRRPSGREAYPGDVFYLHSRLLERSCRLERGGSITALPIIETLEGDVSAYIPTNVISITDGQIFLDSDLFNSGLRPAINVGLSVSRVGGSAQTKAMKSVAGKLKLDLAQYRELAAFAQFEGDLDEKTKAFIDRGSRLTALLKQAPHAPLTMAQQVVVFFAAKSGYFDKVATSEVISYQNKLLEKVALNLPTILDEIASAQKLDEGNEEKLIKIINSIK